MLMFYLLTLNFNINFPTEERYNFIFIGKVRFGLIKPTSEELKTIHYNTFRLHRPWVFVLKMDSKKIFFSHRILSIGSGL